MIKTSFKPYLPFLLLISFVSFLNILARVIFSPLTPLICSEMNLCHADTGNMFLVLSFGFGITLFLSQYFSAKFSHKITIITSVLLTGIALMMVSYADTFQILRASLFIIGISAGLFIPSAVAMIRELTPNEHLGKAFGIFGTAQSFAFILAPLLIEFFSQFYTWKGILNGFGLVSALLSLSLLFLIRRKEEKSQPITFAFAREIFSWPSFWILMVLLCVINGLNIGIYNMAPDYFERHNLLDEKNVNHFIIFARAIGIGTAVLGGIIADRLGLKRALVLILMVCGIVTAAMGMAKPQAALALFCIQSPIAAALMPIIHFGMATIVTAEKNAALVSLMAPFGFTFGAGVVPQILGFLGDFNLYAQGFIMFGTVAMVGGALFGLGAIYKHVELRQIDR